MSEQDRMKSLIACIAHHCPPIKNQSDLLKRHAVRIMIFQSHHERIMRRFSGQEKLIEIERHLRQAELKLNTLQNEHADVFGSVVQAMPDTNFEQREANQNGIPPVTEQAVKRTIVEWIDKRSGDVRCEQKEELITISRLPENPEKLQNRLEAISSIREGIKKFSQSYVGKAEPLRTSEKTEPAAIASACRQTWREVYGDAKVPKKPRANPLGPMCRFIDDVFDILEPRDPKNQNKIIEPNPKSALDFVDRLGGDDALELSLTWG